MGWFDRCSGCRCSRYPRWPVQCAWRGGPASTPGWRRPPAGAWLHVVRGRGFRVDPGPPRQVPASIAGMGELCGAVVGHGCAAPLAVSGCTVLVVCTCPAPKITPPVTRVTPGATSQRLMSRRTCSNICDATRSSARRDKSDHRDSWDYAIARGRSPMRNNSAIGPPPGRRLCWSRLRRAPRGLRVHRARCVRVPGAPKITTSVTCVTRWATSQRLRLRRTCPNICDATRSSARRDKSDHRDSWDYVIARGRSPMRKESAIGSPPRTTCTHTCEWARTLRPSPRSWLSTWRGRPLSTLKPRPRTRATRSPREAGASRGLRAGGHAKHTESQRGRPRSASGGRHPRREPTYPHRARRTAAGESPRNRSNARARPEDDAPR